MGVWALATNEEPPEVIFYDKSSTFGKIASSKIFFNIGIGVTIVFLMWLGIDTDFNAASSFMDSAIHFLTVGLFMVLYFTMELTVRFIAFSSKKDVFKCSSFVIDSILLIFMYFPFSTYTGLVRLANLFALFRVGRFFRRPFPNNDMPVKELVIRTVIDFILSALNFTYIWSMLLVRLTADTVAGESYFQTVAAGMGDIWNIGGVSNAFMDDDHGLALALVPYYAFFVVILVLLAHNIAVVVRSKPSTATNAQNAKTLEQSTIGDDCQ